MRRTKRLLALLLICCMILSATPVSQALAAGESDAYNAILNALYNLADELDVSRYNMTPDALVALYSEILTDHPDLFFVTGTVWGTVNGGYMSKITFRDPDHPMYNDKATKENIARYKAAEDKALVEAMGSVDGAGLTDLEKCLVLHDWVALNITYNYEIANLTSIYDVPMDPDYHSAYGALIYRSVDCGGFSNCYRALLSRVGIKSGLVTSPLDKMAHTWTWVLLDDEYYHVDVTADNIMTTINGKTCDMPGWCSHAVFLRSSDGFGYDEVNGHYTHWGYDGIDPALCRSDKYESGHLFNNDQFMSFFGANGRVIYNENGEWKTAPHDLRGSYDGRSYAATRVVSFGADKIAYMYDYETVRCYSPRSGREFDMFRQTTDSTICLDKDPMYFDAVDLLQVNGTANPTVVSYSSAYPEYKVAFDANGGSTSETVRYYMMGENYSSDYFGGALPNAYKLGDELLGWTTTRNNVSTIVSAADTLKPNVEGDSFNGDRTLYALWKNSAFADVPQSSYYADAVAWSVKNGVTLGTGGDRFSPSETCTRAQVVTFLWRAVGKPEPTTSANPFTDVTPADYFYKPVLWAVENNITLGTTLTTFSPYDSCKDEQIITFLWRAVGRPTPEFGLYYEAPQAWAQANGMFSNTGFAVGRNCSRANTVEWIYRYKLSD